MIVSATSLLKDHEPVSSGVSIRECGVSSADAKIGDIINHVSAICNSCLRVPVIMLHLIAAKEKKCLALIYFINIGPKSNSETKRSS